MIALFLAGSFLIALLLGIVMIPNILLVSYRKRLFDLPDPRKVHTCPVPRLGGISFLPAIVITFALIMGFRILHGIPVEIFHCRVPCMNSCFTLSVPCCCI